MTLMQRRRALMGAGGIVLPQVPTGYITDGLVFFLDGKQLATSASWTDIVGKKQFALTDCEKISNGILFNGSSVGIHPGPVSADWANETIEVIFTAPDGMNSAPTVDIRARAVFCQPYINEASNVGISCRFGNYGSTVRLAIALDGVKRDVRGYDGIGGSTPYLHCLSITNDGYVLNRNVMIHVYGGGSTSYSKNTTGNTVLGASATTSIAGKLVGTIHAVRIYNRKLTEAEMKANQARDLSYYNLA